MLDNYANACEGKVQYPNKQWAIEASKNIQISNENRVKYGIAGRKNFGKVKVYLCPFCHFWHIGHYTGYKGVKH